VVIAYQGVVASEAIAAAGLAGEARRDIGVLAVTSADRLNAGWQAAQRAQARARCDQPYRAAARPPAPALHLDHRHRRASRDPVLDRQRRGSPGSASSTSARPVRRATSTGNSASTGTRSSR
jgi:pyruvate dehydrogenase E1 component